MKNQSHLFGTTLRLLFLLVHMPLSGATLLATSQGIAGGGTRNPDLLGIRFEFGHGDFQTPIVRLFDDVIVTEAEVGQVFVADETSVPLFAAFSTMLTNGIDDILWNGHQTVERNWQRGGQTLLESSDGFLGLQFIPTRRGPDLEGYSISRVEMEVREMAIDSPGSDPGGDGLWTDYLGIVEYRIYGESIPETTPFSLMLLSVIGAVLVRRRPPG